MATSAGPNYLTGVKECLRRAKAKLEGGHWCRRSNAKNASGKVVDPTSKDAVRWSVYHSIDSIEASFDVRHRAHRTMALAFTKLGADTVSYFFRLNAIELEFMETEQQVMDWFDAAIRSLPV